MNNKLKLLHVISGLGVGGAEFMLFRLLKQSQKEGIDSKIICLGIESFIADSIRSLGIEVFNIGLHRKGLNKFKKLVQMVIVLRRYSPDIVQGWMYHGNLAATIIKLFLSSRSKLLWNVRQTLQTIENEKPLTRQVIRLNSLCSWIPTTIIYNSFESRFQHEAIGFRGKFGVVVPNGIDLDEFFRSKTISKEVRTEIGIADGVLVLGHIGRYHPKKDHKSLIRALATICKKHEELVFILVGKGVDEDNVELCKLLEESELNSHAILLGERNDISRLLNAVDVLLVSSAWGEGFPNVLAEAMATEICCVTTDLGDSSNIVSIYGKIVPPKNSQELASAVLSFLDLPLQVRTEIGRGARNRIDEYYSIRSISKQYKNLYCSAVNLSEGS